MAEPGATGTTTLRESWRARIYNVVLITAFMLWLIARSDGTAAIVFGCFGVLLVLGELYRLYRPVAVLSPTELLVNNMRPRKVPWAELREITSEVRLGSRRIVLILQDDSRVLMEAPTSTLLAKSRFESAIASIRQYWVANRGADWKPREPATPAGSGQSTEGGTPNGLSKG